MFSTIVHIVLGVSIFAFMGVVTINLLAVHHANKILWEMPWLKWLSLDEIVRMGFSRYWSRILLPMFYEKGYLEIRLNIPAEVVGLMRKRIEQMPFDSFTVQYYEFKLTKRGRRKRRKFEILKIIPDWQPA